MRGLVVLALIALAGCAADPANLEKVAVEESSLLQKPNKPLSTFADYELKPFKLGIGVTAEEGKVREAGVLEGKVRAKLLPLLAEWSEARRAGSAGTLIVQPVLMRLKIVSGGARFWGGAFAGESTIDLDLQLIDGRTNETIARPRISRDANAFTGAWSIGQSDQNLHDYIAYIAHKYLTTNY